MKHIAQAIIAVTKEIKGVEKNSKVGSGSYGYKGVSDKDVKLIVREAMTKHGLCLVPTNVESTTEVARREEKGKNKQSVLTTVNTKYMLLHESGESIEIAGYGHGVDTQDKGAGKATTYALKYALLYTFLIPTGDIDDADSTHSQDMDQPKKDEGTKKKAKPVFGTTEYDKWIAKDELMGLEKIKEYYTVTSEMENTILETIDLRNSGLIS